MKLNIKFTIKNRMIIGFGVITGVVLICFIYIFFTLQAIQKNTDINLNLYSPSVAKINNLYVLINNSKMLIKNWVFVERQTDTPDKLKLKKLHLADYPAIKTDLLPLSESWTDADKKTLDSLFKTIEDTLFAKHKLIMSKLISFESYEDPTVVFDINPMVAEEGEITVLTEKILFRLNLIQKDIAEKANTGNSEILSSISTFRGFIIFFTLIIISIAIISSFLTIRSILVPIATLKESLIEKSKGIFIKQEIVRREDEIGEMTEAINIMTASIRNIVNDIRISADILTTSSTQISNSASGIASGASEQAASTEEVSASIQEMSSSIGQNAENARHTEKIALNLAANIDEISNVVNNTTKAMNDIANKILIINDIAARIDLLAINAAIEAARAGEHGKGFAVVASEVRSLAENSQRAANTIDEVSRNSVEVANQSKKLLDAIIPEIENTVKLVQEISTASIEQNTGINQVDSAIQQLSMVTQQNSASAEELSASSEELLTQSKNLMVSVAFFKTKEEDVEDISTNELEEQILKLQSLLLKRKKKNIRPVAEQPITERDVHFEAPQRKIKEVPKNNLNDINMDSIEEPDDKNFQKY